MKKSFPGHFVAFVCGAMAYNMYTHALMLKIFLEDKISSIPAGAFTPVQCTEGIRDIIKKQLPSDKCIQNQEFPFSNRCSFCFASRCPKATWIEDYYRENEKHLGPFLGISVGCNKGYDALNVMRMGTFDSYLDKDHWRKVRDDKNVDIRCGLQNYEQFQIVPNTKIRTGEMHCIEALPTNFRKLERASKAMGIDKKGFIVANAAMGDHDGVAQFPTGEGLEDGIENLGLGHCNRGENCGEVDLLTLDTYTKQFVTSQNAINHLSIDIEGFDVDALYSGDETLDRTDYVEFEYNWMGNWAEHKLADVLEYMEKKGFSCYWIGNNELWRITGGCWLDHYDIHYWSNIGCVHETRARGIFKKMEKKFNETLSLKPGKLNYVSQSYSNPLDRSYMYQIRRSN